MHVLLSRNQGLELVVACAVITKELSTKGQQIFQGVLHSATLSLRAVEHANTSHEHPFLAAEGWLSPQRKASRLPAPLWGLLSAAPASGAAARPRCWGRGRQPATEAVFPLPLFFFLMTNKRKAGCEARPGVLEVGQQDAVTPQSCPVALSHRLGHEARPHGAGDASGSKQPALLRGRWQHGGLQTALGGGKCPQPPVALLP